MSTRLVNLTFGTAGHIDHGKTALIKCLTGCDTDRLKAEKQRGMSIELGFAPCTISDMEIGIVDVPGHENFIKTMVAGASCIDAVIFVVAADDGVMLQTREHLDILTLLGVKHGVVALTKADMVGDERLEEVAAEVEDFLCETFLEGFSIFALSSVTGQGLGEFYEGLKALAADIKPKETDGVFRLPIERAFSLKGYGTVVTGIPVSGSARVGDEITLLPHNLKGRIKAIQVYKHQSNQALSGQCAALNVPKWDYKNISRGDVIAAEGFFEPVEWFICDLTILPSNTMKLKNGSQIRLHTGTSEVAASLYLLKPAKIEPGGRGLVQIRTAKPVVAGPRDRFVVRSMSPASTIGGGIIVEALAHKLSRTDDLAVADANQAAEAIRNDGEFIEYSVRTVEALATTVNELSLRAKLPPAKVESVLQELVGQSKIVKLGPKMFAHKDSLDKVSGSLIGIVGQFHREQPASPGIKPDELCRRSSLSPEVFDELLKLLLSSRKLTQAKRRITLPQYTETFTEEEKELLRAAEALFSQSPFSPPRPEDLAQQMNIDAVAAKKVIGILLEHERLIEVEKGLIFHADAVSSAEKKLRAYIEQHGSLESVKFKYILDTSRKFAIPLLDYFDRIGLTRRDGYTRHLKQ